MQITLSTQFHTLDGSLLRHRPPSPHRWLYTERLSFLVVKKHLPAPVPHVSYAKPCFSGVGHKHNQVTVHKIQHTYMLMLGSSAHASLGSSRHIAQTANDQDKTPISSSSSLSPTPSAGLSQGAMSPRPSSASISQLMSVVTMILVSRRLHRVR